MRPAKMLARALFLVSALALVFAADAVSGRASAQVVCAYGYYWDPVYGCVPVPYFYGPPYYAYPDLGFGFFYGPAWRGGHYHGYGPPHGAPHGGSGHHR
ncbi:MAG TPA: hypothetical protein VLV50_19250 [Stellaceae bacterium]|nr:hypothetical protein [Stellaceae bacterium]